MKTIKKRKMKVNVKQNPPTLPETGKSRGWLRIGVLPGQESLTCRNSTGISGDSLNSVILLGRVDQSSHIRCCEHFNPISYE